VRFGTLLDKTFRHLSFRGLSPLGIVLKGAGSLASRFSPGIVAGVADLILANTSVGLRDAFRLSWSCEKTLSSDLGALVGTGLLVIVPGMAGAFAAVVAGRFFGFGGDTTTGPPNLWFRDSHNSGSRPAKLQWLALRQSSVRQVQ
jgi:hypothetical protein